jgi:hypothetical protein
VLNWLRKDNYFRYFFYQGKSQVLFWLTLSIFVLMVLMLASPGIVAGVCAYASEHEEVLPWLSDPVNQGYLFIYLFAWLFSLGYFAYVGPSCGEPGVEGAVAIVFIIAEIGLLMATRGAMSLVF